jgi:LPXTG-motif cell wall-anchored protein
VSDNVVLPLAGSILLAGGIYFISRKVKNPMDTKRR